MSQLKKELLVQTVSSTEEDLMHLRLIIIRQNPIQPSGEQRVAMQQIQGVIQNAFPGATMIQQPKYMEAELNILLTRQEYEGLGKPVPGETITISFTRDKTD